VNKFGDPNYEIVKVAIFNYTRSDIYDVYLSNPGPTDIDRASGVMGSPAAEDGGGDWQDIGIMSTLAWDWRWQTPKHFNLIWLSIVDQQAYESKGDYNPYRSKETAPGSAWCQLDITFDVPPDRSKGNLYLLHFFPDGHVITSRVDQIPVPIAEFKDRASLPVLKGYPCLHTVPNPKFGKQEPRFTE
jgi:hypothetical protein